MSVPVSEADEHVTYKEIIADYERAQFPSIGRDTSPASITDYQKATRVFIENKGQFDVSARFVAVTEFGKALFFDSKVQYLLERYEGSNLSGTETVTLAFPGSLIVTPIGQDPLSYYSNYFVGDPSTWVRGVKNYHSIVYHDLWPGIDLTYRFSEKGLKYEFVVGAHVSEDLIQVQVQGADILADASALKLDTGHGMLIDDALLVTQGHSCLRLSAGYAAIEDVFSFVIEGREPSQELVIDPLIYSSYMGGGGNDDAQSVAIDNAGNVYLVGYTSSNNLPISSPYQDHHRGGTYDAFVLKLNAAGNSLAYLTYLGGSGEDYGQGIAVDATGNAFVIGYTGSTDFPISESYQTSFGGGTNDVFVVKLDATGSALVYSSYIGGNGDDQGYDVAIDPSGNAFVTGRTSGDFRLSPAAIQPIYGGGTYDAFVLKLNPAGSALVYSTYIGGSGRDDGLGIALCSCYRPYVVGQTDSTDFPTTNGSYQQSCAGGIDAFVLWVNDLGTGFEYSTYVGGEGSDIAKDVAVEIGNYAHVTGWTNSSDFPTQLPYQAAYNGGSTDAFVLKLSYYGTALVYSTFLGGSREDYGQGIAVDATGNAFVTGGTNSADFPTINPYQSSNAGQSDAFVVKLINGSSLANSTYVGGSYDENGNGIAVDASGNAYVVGVTTSADLPISAPFQGTYEGAGDAFIFKLSPTNAPSQPLDLAAQEGTSQVTLTWSPPVSNGGSAIVGYKVFRGAAPSAETLLTTLGNVLTFTDVTLTNGQIFYYKVSAFNSVGEGPLSNELSTMPVGPPIGLLCLHAIPGDASINLTWQAPSSDGGSAITNYQVWRSTTSGTETFLTNAGLKLWFNDSGLINGQIYYYQVKAENAQGLGPNSCEISTIPSKVVIAPTAPQNLQAKPGNAQVTLTWSAPSNNGSSAITYYIIYRSTTSGGETFQVTLGKVLSYTDASLDNGQAYWYKVSAGNVEGAGPNSTEVQAIPLAALPSDSTGLFVAIGVVAVLGIASAAMVIMRKKK